MLLTEQLTIADQLRLQGGTMLEPRQLPGRYGRVIVALEKLLDAANATAVVAGGWAVWYHGYVGRVTQDVDIVIAIVSQEELLRIAPVCGFDVLDAPHGRWPKLVHRETGIEVDFLPETAFPGTAHHRAPVPIRHPDVYGAERGRLRYISLECLCELKLGAHRAKDIADLVELIKVNPGRLSSIHDALAVIHTEYAHEFKDLITQANEE